MVVLGGSRWPLQTARLLSTHYSYYYYHHYYYYYYYHHYHYYQDFSDSGPFLFGSGFAKKAKERAEEVEYLRKASTITRKTGNYAAKKRFFRGDHSQGDSGHGGGFNTRTNYGLNQQFQNKYRKNSQLKNGTNRGAKDQ